MFNKYYIPETEDNWSQLGQNSNFIIDVTSHVNGVIINNNFDEDELNISFQNLPNNQFKVTVSQGLGFANLPLSLSRVYSFEVQLTDDYDNVIGVIAFRINYIASSTTPLD